MDEKKDITISNSAFTLTIHWNGKLFGTQMSIIGMCALVYIFASNAAVKRLCIGIIIIDILAIVLSMFFKGAVTDTSKETKKEESAVNSTPTETPPAKVTTKTPSNKSSTKTQNKQITNKLQVATPKQQPVTAAIPATKPAAPVQPIPGQVIEPVQAPTQPEPITVEPETISADDISLDDFNFDDFDL